MDSSNSSDDFSIQGMYGYPMEPYNIIESPPRNSHTSHTNLHHNSISPWNKEHHGVTTLYRCDAADARALYIFDGAYKLLQSDQYDIGGAYTDFDSGLWFYFTASSVPGRNYLMNIFVCQRKPGMFSLGISNSNKLSTTIYNNDRVRILSDELYWQNFNSTKPDEVKYIKTFCFSEEDRISLSNMVLIIPILINISPKTMLNMQIVQKIKAELQFGADLFKHQEPDFLLKSCEGKEFNVHKIVLAAHSPVLRELIRAKDCNTLSLDNTTYEIELLWEYLYTGMIKDILNQQLEVLLVMADKFQLHNLRDLIKQAMKLAVNSENAIAIAVVAEKYNCGEVQEVAFKYIAQHPEVLESDAFSEINNANLVKKILRFIHVNKA